MTNKNITLPDGWRLAVLENVCQNISRPFSFNEHEKVIFVNTGDVLEGKFLHSNYSGKEGLPGQAKKAIKKGDILYSEIRPKNRRYALVDFDAENYVVSTKFMVLEKKKEVYLGFLYILLTSRKFIQEFNNVAESRFWTFPQITFDSIKNTPIFLPSYSEQKSIASILSSFDNKIELLREQNKTLEKTAQTLYQEWFGKYSVDRPDELPEGWRIRPLSWIADFLNWLALQKYPANNNQDDLNVIKIKEINNWITIQTDKCNSGVPSKYVIQNWDIIFSWSWSLKVVIWEHWEWALNQHLFKVESSDFPKWFYYYWTKFHIREFRNIANSKATTMWHINRGHLDQALVIVPDTDAMEWYTNLMSPVLDKIVSNNSQIHLLSKARDTLLPKLMSGEVRVSNW